MKALVFDTETRGLVSSRMVRDDRAGFANNLMPSFQVSVDTGFGPSLRTREQEDPTQGDLWGVLPYKKNSRKPSSISITARARSAGRAGVSPACSSKRRIC